MFRQGAGGKGPPVEGVNGNWKCTACGNINFGTRELCHRCSLPKPPADVIAVRDLQLNEERQQEAAAGFNPRGFRTNSRICAKDHRGTPIEGLDGNWKCGQVHLPAPSAVPS